MSTCGRNGGWNESWTEAQSVSSAAVAFGERAAEFSPARANAEELARAGQTPVELGEVLIFCFLNGTLLRLTL